MTGASHIWSYQHLCSDFDRSSDEALHDSRFSNTCGNVCIPPIGHAFGSEGYQHFRCTERGVPITSLLATNLTDFHSTEAGRTGSGYSRIAEITTEASPRGMTWTDSVMMERLDCSTQTVSAGLSMIAGAESMCRFQRRKVWASKWS